ncbi:MerR family transcriptional regulator [Nocardia sp. alder85J]|uniref:MerR family transcriptional regulator n=1 Tax=Nocardia sp. alder85J TaxID=2862949 RepID=UPI001CD810ED|nr:MerR family transcriptional regulator [Nocardia sp. alder85J]MCX4094177.1 MerR family transcriptional regulator [Nocardia sp. alder85J]
MRIAELSRTTGVSTATIKYYVREGLLPPGERTHANQVDYGPAHARRLRLVRALIEIGGLSITDAARVLEVLDEGEHSTWESVGKAQYTLDRRRAVTPGDDPAARAAVEALLARRGWRVQADSPARDTLIEVCATLHRLGHDDFVAALDGYADAVERIAAVDVAVVARQPSLEQTVESVIVGTVLGDTLLAALRRLAQEHLSRDALA